MAASRRGSTWRTGRTTRLSAWRSSPFIERWRGWRTMERSKIVCPREKSAMTPCVARDGKLACADDGVCVGCGEHPADLLAEIVPKYVSLQQVIRRIEDAPDRG